MREREYSGDSSPESVVLGFLADYEVWNERACDRDDEATDEDDEKADVLSEIEYMELVARYCVEGLVPQSISYGLPSSHGATDKISDVGMNDSRAIITVTREEPFVSLGIRPQITEFHLVSTSTGWRISNAYGVLNGDKYELL